MRRLALGLLLAGCASAPPSELRLPPMQPMQQAPRGNVRVVAEPPDAELSVDGVLQGLAQDYDGTHGALQLAAGPHQLELRKSGYQPFRITVYATDEGTQGVNVALEKD